MHFVSLGNTLGYYFNDLACASVSGAHFVAVKKKFEITLPETFLAKSNESLYSFFNALPNIYVNPNHSQFDYSQIRSNLLKKCDCLQYCWENKAAPWIQRTDLIRQSMRKAIDTYMSYINIDEATILNNQTDLYYHPKHNRYYQNEKDYDSTIKMIPKFISKMEKNGENLPVFPNITIQYRCGDNIGFGKTRYGLLPFEAITHRIPAHTKYIYVIADSPKRQSYHVYSNRCGIILTELFLYIRRKFPDSVLIIKRGKHFQEFYVSSSHSGFMQVEIYSLI
jgi:hypothetical protein